MEFATALGTGNKIRQNENLKCFLGVVSRICLQLCLRRPLRGERPPAALRGPSGVRNTRFRPDESPGGDNKCEVKCSRNAS